MDKWNVRKVGCILGLLLLAATTSSCSQSSNETESVDTESTETESEQTESAETDLVKEEEKAQDISTEDDSNLMFFDPSRIDSFRTDADVSAVKDKYVVGDWSIITKENLYGTWYDPVMGDVVVLSEEGAYAYLPYIECFGDQLYEWEVIDRSERGLCPELAIYISGRDAGPLAYYILGMEDEYFWGSELIFYKQEDAN